MDFPTLRTQEEYDNYMLTLEEQTSFKWRGSRKQPTELNIWWLYRSNTAIWLDHSDLSIEFFDLEELSLLSQQNTVTTKNIESPLFLENIISVFDEFDRDNLLAIRQRFTHEGFDTRYGRIIILEKPTDGVYVVGERLANGCIHELTTMIHINGEMIPHYMTLELDENGHNTHPCRSIREAIKLDEY